MVFAKCPNSGTLQSFAWRVKQGLFPAGEDVVEMLCELRVKNLALIESLELSFLHGDGSGLVVMTGETGAGKSIMMRAIQLLFGGRAAVDWIRGGADSCEVEAMFELPRHHRRLLEKLEESGFGADGVLVIKRIFTTAGRSRFFVNGSLATAAGVAGLTGDLLSVAGQHDHQQLLQPSLHLDILDTYGDLWQERQEFARHFGQWQEKKTLLAELRRREQEKVQKQDFLKFQATEIAQAAIGPREDELLVVEKKKLKNAQALIKLSQESLHLLGGEIRDGLRQLRQNMTSLAGLDPLAAKLSEEIGGFTFVAEDCIGMLRAYRDGLEEDPYRLEQVNERLDQLRQLQRKYGETLAEVIAFGKRCEEELQLLESLDKTIAAAAEELKSLEKELLARAMRLSQRRRQVGRDMEQAMSGELASLAFDRARFLVSWREVEENVDNLRASGWDRGEFFFSPNLGEDPKPLAKIASGGELSRLLLAMKCLLARKDEVETVIFDEVDAGIGGQAAEAVARKIQELAGHHQVLCITHLPQIAARGSLHFRVSKQVVEGRTQSAVSRLTPEERVGELSRMLAGDAITAQTAAFAAELLAKRGSC